MAFESILRRDLISNNDELQQGPSNLTIVPQSARVVSAEEFNRLLHMSNTMERTKSPLPAKNIIETMELVRLAFVDYESRTNKNKDAQIHFTYELPDQDINLETITIALESRVPGMFGQGKPGESGVKNLRPILRETMDDPDNPGYKRAILGYFHDNIVRITCWARTSKAANMRALWVEDVLEEYTWFFVRSGVNRFLYDGRRAETSHNVGNNVFYGRPIDYFVRTEKLRSVSQKTLEQIYVNLTTYTGRTE